MLFLMGQPHPAQNLIENGEIPYYNNAKNLPLAALLHTNDLRPGAHEQL